MLINNYFLIGLIITLILISTLGGGKVSSIVFGSLISLILFEIIKFIRLI